MFQLVIISRIRMFKTLYAKRLFCQRREWCKMRSKRVGSSATPYLGSHVWREGERHERGNGGIEETRTNPVVGFNTCLQGGLSTPLP